MYCIFIIVFLLAPYHLNESFMVNTLRGGGHYSKSIPFIMFPVFQNYGNTCYLLNITFIFDRCRHSLAVVTPVNYECDLKNLISIFAR